MYRIVTFSNTEPPEVQLVPKVWLTDSDGCLWPPLRPGQLSKAIKDCLPPGDNWTVYPVREIGSAATYEIGMKKAKQAETTSDLQSDAAEAPPSKRIRIRNTRYISDSESEYEPDLDTEISLPDVPDPFKTRQEPPSPLLPRSHQSSQSTSIPAFHVPQEPNPVTSSLVRSSPRQSSTVSLLSQQSSPVLSSPRPPSTVLSSSQQLSSDLSSPLQSPSVLLSPRPFHSPSQLCSDLSPRPLVQPSSVQPSDHQSSRPHASQDQPPPSLGQPRSADIGFIALERHAVTPFEKAMFGVMKAFREHQNHQTQIMSQILTRLVLSRASTELPEGVVLPLSTSDDVRRVDVLMADPEKARQMVNYLSGLGGSSAGDATRRVMVKLLTDALARNYNYKGKGGKIAFSRLRLNDIVIRAVRTSVEATELDIEGHVKLWLKFAKKRVQGRRRQAPNELV